MGANKNKKTESSNGDPLGRVQNQITEQTNRYNKQQGPMMNQFANMTGRANEANYGDYTDIMNQYRGIASGQDAAGGGGGGGAAGWGPSLISYNDPFKSYGGYTEFSETGGYSPNDISNMRARGVSPIRAAYANAEREVGRQRSLQGGYSPNAIATQARMAREQGQSAADATQNVEAGLAQARNTGRLAGLGGMSDIEKQRLAADLDVSKFNAQAQMSSAASNAGASNAAYSDAMRNRMNALEGMTSLYGATPGMSQLFGNQAINTMNSGGNFGIGMVNANTAAQQLPGQFDQTMNRTNRVMDMINTGVGAVGQVMDRRKPQQPQQQPKQPVYSGNYYDPEMYPDYQ